MMDTYRIVIMPRVASDLEDIYKFIAIDSEQNAAGMIRRIIAAFAGDRHISASHDHQKAKQEIAVSCPISSSSSIHYLFPGSRR